MAIPLTQGNPDPYLDNYLDLNIKIERSRFLFKIYHEVDDFNFKVVSFPFLKFNIHSAIGYNAFLYSQIAIQWRPSINRSMLTRGHMLAT
jgi:hypothetical protein